MRKFSKGISLILAICMIIAMVPAAFAAVGETVTVSLFDRVKYEDTTHAIPTTNINSNNGSLSSGYTIVWEDGNTEFVADKTKMTNFREVILKNAASGATVNHGVYKWPLGTSNSGVQFTFKTKLAGGTYDIDITPIMSMRGCTYGVWVGGQYAGSVDTYENHAGTWNSNAYANASVSLNTLDITPGADGWVEVTIKEMSVPAGNTSGVSSLGFKDITFTSVPSVQCTDINENISDAELYVGRTLDFVISPVMSDGSTRYFDTSDANSYITASVADGSSVTISDTVMKADGLHGKLNALSAEEATINVAVTLGGVTTNHTINVTPIAALVPVETTVSLFDRVNYDDTTHVITTTNINSNNGSLSTGYTIVWEGGNTEYVQSKTTMTNFRELILKNAASGATVNHGVYKWPIGSSTADSQFTFRTKLADGSYKVSMVPVISMRGCTYGVYVNGQYAGKVDTYEAHAGTWNSNAYANASVSLNTLDIKGDAQGWVEVTIKKLSVPAGNTSGACSLGFKDITFTPTDDLEVSSLTENITSTDIYKGDEREFYIKAVMNDGQIHKFDTSNTADKIEASVPAGSAVTLSELVMKEDGLYGKITGVGDDEKATITVKTTINGVVDTKTINALSFATEVKTPETVVVSMHTAGTGSGGIAYDNDVVHNKPNGYNYVKGSSEITWANNDKVRLDKDNTNITHFREYAGRACIAFPYVENPVADTEYAFAMKVRAAAGTYKVDLTYPTTVGGCKYEVIIGGTSVGTVDCSSTTTGWQEAYGAKSADLSNVTVTPDEDGWVSVKLKYIGAGANTTVNNHCFFFTNLTLTPTVKLYAAADTVDGDVDGLVTAEGYTADTVADVEFGKPITLTANNVGDYTFLYWINNSSKMYISEEPTYTFDATSNLAISAVYTRAGNTRYDYFTDMGERISSGFGTAPTAPAIPTKIGYDVSAVTWESKKEHKVADYEAYAPDYSGEVAQTFTVNGEGSYSFNDPAEVSSNDSDFSYWEKNDKIVSYNKTYSFFVWGNETVEAVCNGALTAAEKKPAVVLFSNGSDHMLELVGFDGITIVEKGILFANSGKPTISSNFGKAKSTTSNNQFAVTADYAVARAYVVYKDGANLKVVYSD